MKMIKTLRRLAFALLFLLMLHLAARWLGLAFYSMLQRENAHADLFSYYFSTTKRNSVDTVFIGSSHQYHSVDVNLLNREYGENSILLASSSQSLVLSHYAAMAAIELQHPKTIVLEMVYARFPEVIEPMAANRLLDNLPDWTYTKYYATRDMGVEPYLHYYPLTGTHNNWYKLRLEDFRLPRRLEKDERLVMYAPQSNPQEPWELIPPDQKAPMPADTEARLEQIVRLCEENGVQLILYTAPGRAPASAQEIYNGLNDFAREHGLRYRNMMYDMEAIGLDLASDFVDDGHLSASGQKKLTRFLAETLLTA